MVKHDQRKFVFLIIGTAFTTWLLVTCAKQGLKIDEQSLHNIPTSITIDVILWGFFVTYMWKWRVFKGWLIQIPDLSGKWEGFLLSNWVNPATSTKLAAIPASVNISQTFFHINVKVRTGEMESNSSAGTFDIDFERGIKRLWYSYVSTPSAIVRPRSPMHFGTTLLEIKEDDECVLEGEYWTSRETTGTIELKRCDK